MEMEFRGMDLGITLLASFTIISIMTVTTRIIRYGLTPRLITGPVEFDLLERESVCESEKRVVG